MAKTAAPVIRLAIADDHDLFRDGIVAILGHDPLVDVVAEASDGHDALRVAIAHRPHVLLLDVEMPGPGAATTVRRIRRHAPETRIVVLTMHRDAMLTESLRQAGAAAYLTKTMPSADLLRAVHAVAARTDQTAVGVDLELVSPREYEVLRLIALARSNAEIARELSITEGTVKRHTSNLYAKLGATSRIDAVRRALLLGVLGHDD